MIIIINHDFSSECFLIMAKKLHHTKLSKSVRNLSLSGSKTVHINKNDLQAPITKDDGFQVDKQVPQ